jgi:hypothetical protein
MKKHKIIVSFLIVLGITNLNAQVGLQINNNPNPDAVLDLSNPTGNTKGLLLPKVALKDSNTADPLSTHTAGMHVYNTATSGSGLYKVIPGEYYNDGSKWIRIAGSAWALGGLNNTSINANVNAIGTSDDSNFRLGINGVIRTTVTTNGNVLVGTKTIPTGGDNAKLIAVDAGNFSALRIVDGNEQIGATLVSDANGVASWQKLDNITTVYKSTVAQTFPTAINTTLQTSQTMKIPTKGTYLTTLRWWGKNDGPNPNGVVSAYISLLKNGVAVDNIEYYLTISGALYNTFNVTLLAPNCAVGDVLTIQIRPSIGITTTANWYTGSAGVNSNFMPSIVVSKL